ncbi:MAG: hypothetical protein AABZ55_03060 [Bdellovibrionota bacterium]
MEYNLTDQWIRKNPNRWIAGALGGLFAGTVMAVVAMLVSAKVGMQPTFPLKLVASVLLGAQATDYEAGAHFILLGLIAHEVLAMFIGIIFGHFVTAKTFVGNTAMGLVWGLFSWIFMWNLFFQSFSTVLAAHISSAAVFPICLAFGISLASVGLFDRLMSN